MLLLVFYLIWFTFQYLSQFTSTWVLKENENFQQKQLIIIIIIIMINDNLVKKMHLERRIIRKSTWPSTNQLVATWLGDPHRIGSGPDDWWSSCLEYYCQLIPLTSVQWTSSRLAREKGRAVRQRLWSSGQEMYTPSFQFS